MNIILMEVAKMFGLDTNQFDFQLLRQALVDGTAMKQFPIGSSFLDWVDKSNNPLMVVDYRTVRLANGESKMAAILLRMYPLNFRMEFDGYTHNAKGEWVHGSRYDYAVLRQWLNYNGDSRDWWKPCRKGDSSAVSYYGKERPKGYLSYCTKELREAITPIVVETPIFDEAGNRISVSTTVDLAFPPSCEEMFIDVGNGIDLQKTAWRFFSRWGRSTFTRGGKRYYSDGDAGENYISDLGRVAAVEYCAFNWGMCNLPDNHEWCWTRNAVPRFGSGGRFIETRVYAINPTGEIEDCDTGNRLLVLPAHAIVG